jgi:hypothetical protein
MGTSCFDSIRVFSFAQILFVRRIPYEYSSKIYCKDINTVTLWIGSGHTFQPTDNR